MNAPHLHLILTHLPLLGLVFSILLLGFAIWRRNADLRTVALVAVAVAGLLSIPVLMSGEAAEDVLEHMPGIAEAAVERHEDAGEIAGRLALLAGAAALLALGVQRYWPRRAALATGGVVLVGLIAVVALGRAANLGGQIRHPEISGASTVAMADGAGASEEEHAGGPFTAPADAAFGDDDDDDEEDERDDD